MNNIQKKIIPDDLYKKYMQFILYWLIYQPNCVIIRYR